MKILSLYVDKWYIVGAAIDGANKYPLSLSNAEERVWLYFYSNKTLNTVKYTLDYKDEALEGKPGYYMDVFDRLPNYKEYHYEMFGGKKDMKDIFADSGIFADLQKGFDGIDSIPVYISFSEDIDIVSQDIFIKVLSDNKFIVKQYTQSVEYLAIESFKRRGKLSDSKYILTVNACNENLSYSLYKQDAKECVLVDSKKEIGYGVDCRKQAVVDEVLEYLQAATHFLTGDTEERNEEKLFLSQFADSWLERIDAVESKAPIALGDTHFKKQSNNDVQVSVAKSKITDRTKNIIEQLASKVVDLIKSNNVLATDVSHIIFLGDVFCDQTFEQTLQRKIGTKSENIITVSETILPEMVSIYGVWNDDAFKEEKKTHAERAHAKYKKDSRQAIEARTRDLKDKAREAEHAGLLKEAIDYYERILRTDPKDNYAQTRIPALNALIEQRKKDSLRVEELLSNARKAIIADKYAEAQKFSEDALRLQKNNAEAQEIKEKSEEALKRKQILEDYIVKMNSFIMEGQFYDARNILQKVDNLNLNDARLRDIRESIEHGISHLESQVTERTAAYNDARKANDLKLCLRLCEELITIGADSRKWSEIKQSLIKEIKQEQRYQDNFDLARKARLNQNWHELIEYAQKALSVRDENELHGWIAEAKDAINREKVDQVQELFSKSYADGQWEKVIELYDEHTSLHQKSSNSSMYSNAKRFRKNAVHAPKPTPPPVKPKEPVEKTVDTPAQRRTPRPGPSRPNVASRPKVEKQLTSKTNAVEKTQPTQGRPRVNRPQRDLNTIGKKETEKAVGTTPDIETSNNSTNNKRIINKPKR